MEDIPKSYNVPCGIALDKNLDLLREGALRIERSTSKLCVLRRPNDFANMYSRFSIISGICVSFLEMGFVPPFHLLDGVDKLELERLYQLSACSYFVAHLDSVVGHCIRDLIDKYSVAPNGDYDTPILPNREGTVPLTSSFLSSYFTRVSIHKMREGDISCLFVDYGDVREGEFLAFLRNSDYIFNFYLSDEEVFVVSRVLLTQQYRKGDSFERLVATSPYSRKAYTFVVTRGSELPDSSSANDKMMSFWNMGDDELSLIPVSDFVREAKSREPIGGTVRRPKTFLKEWCDMERVRHPVYVVHSHGPVHSQVFFAGVVIFREKREAGSHLIPAEACIRFALGVNVHARKVDAENEAAGVLCQTNVGLSLNGAPAQAAIQEKMYREIKRTYPGALQFAFGWPTGENIRSDPFDGPVSSSDNYFWIKPSPQQVREAARRPLSPVEVIERLASPARIAKKDGIKVSSKPFVPSRMRAVEELVAHPKITSSHSAFHNSVSGSLPSKPPPANPPPLVLSPSVSGGFCGESAEVTDYARGEIVGRSRLFYLTCPDVREGHGIESFLEIRKLSPAFLSGASHVFHEEISRPYSFLRTNPLCVPPGPNPVDLLFFYLLHSAEYRWVFASVQTVENPLGGRVI